MVSIFIPFGPLTSFSDQGRGSGGLPGLGNQQTLQITQCCLLVHDAGFQEGPLPADQELIC